MSNTRLSAAEAADSWLVVWRDARSMGAAVLFGDGVTSSYRTWVRAHVVDMYSKRTHLMTTGQLLQLVDMSRVEIRAKYHGW